MAWAKELCAERDQQPVAARNRIRHGVKPRAAVCRPYHGHKSIAPAAIVALRLDLFSGPQGDNK